MRPQIMSSIEAELLSDMVSMATDCIHGDIEELGYLLGRLTLFREKNHFHFSWGKIETGYLHAEWRKKVLEVSLNDIDKETLIWLQPRLSQHPNIAQYQFSNI